MAVASFAIVAAAAGAIAADDAGPGNRSAMRAASHPRASAPNRSPDRNRRRQRIRNVAAAAAAAADAPVANGCVAVALALAAAAVAVAAFHLASGRLCGLRKREYALFTE